MKEQDHIRIVRRGSLHLLWTLLFVAGIPILLPAQSRTTSHALLIGIGQYSPPSGTAMPVAASGHATDSRFAAGATWHSLRGPLTDIAAMHVLLENTYGFTDIREVTDQQATRQGILEAINKLIDDTQKGDRVVIYYSGHGSQRLDTKSSKNQRDQTIVPVDAWKGVKDIRDKELAILFNKIVYDKQARLTAIYDSCNSGTMARGVTESVQRTLPYDDDDVAKEQGAVLEADLKRIPQQGDAIILAAAGPTQSAVEAVYPEDGQVHGAFTRALIRVLQQNTQALSAEDVVSAVASMLHADPLDFQQPSVEGRVHESLFGDPVSSRELHVHVTKVAQGKITLDVGSAGGFDAGTEFTATKVDSDGEKPVIVVASIDGPTSATATLKNGPAQVKPGDIFAATSMVYPQAARLVVFVPQPGPAPSAAAIATTKALFPSLTWVDDPTEKPVDYLVMEDAKGWIAYGQDGHPVKPGKAATGAAFLLLGPPQSVVDRIRRTEPFKREAFKFTSNLGEANYFLTMRVRADGLPEYALFDQRVLAAHKPEDYVRSEENDPAEADLNGGKNPEVVCRNNFSFPVRTAWLHDATPNATEDSIAPVIARRILRLGKLRVWQQIPSMVSGVTDWPYHLAIVRSNNGALTDPLHPNESYDVRLVTTSEEISKRAISPKYIYLFGFDCAANPYQIFPTDESNGIAQGPPLSADGTFPTTYTIMSESVTAPFGADTLFLLATKEKINNLNLLTYDGVIESGSRGAGLDELMVNLNDAGSRGASPIVTTWQVQQTVVASRP
jgi:Caspase domain